MLPFLGFLSNPITKLVADKVIGAASHAMEKKKIIRAAEIEATKELDIVKLESAKLVSKAEAEVKSAQVKAGTSSLKDEWLTLVFTGILIAHFVPYTQPHILKGWELLNNAPDYFWIIMLTIVGASFGVNTLNKWKK